MLCSLNGCFKRQVTSDTLDVRKHSVVYFIAEKGVLSDKNGYLYIDLYLLSMGRHCPTRIYLKKEGKQPSPEQRINNNIIFRKLKIALNLKAEDVLEILNLSDMDISKHELSAFFRKPGHKHYRNCMDQILRNFLNGIQLKYRDSTIYRGRTKPTS